MEDRAWGWMQRIAKGIVACAMMWFGVHAVSANAASLYLSPTSGSYKPGDSFTVGVYVSATDQAVNAVSGTISFPPAMIEATGASSAGSIINLWSQQPSYSNGSGTMTFEGIILNPGYSGSSGKIASITFTAKAGGTASVAFTTGSVLANDGLGTNVTNGLGRASFVIAESSAAESPITTETPSAAPTAVPAAPAVSSSTHPDPSRWYNNKNPSFSWTLPNGATGVNVLADHNATTDPGTSSDGLRSSYTYTDVDDGEWYFHIKIQNALGWGRTTHYAFRIDTVAPTVRATVESGQDTSVLVLSGADDRSGVDHYEFTFGNEAPVIWTDDGTHRYSVPSLPVGEYPATVRVVDAAGNQAETTVTIQGFVEESVDTDVATPPVSQATAEGTPLSVIVGYGVLGIVLLCAVAMFLWLIWRAIRTASQYKIVLVKREVKRKDPYRGARRKMAHLFERVAKQSASRRRKGLLGKGKAASDKDLEKFVDDVIEAARKLRG